MVAIVCGLWVSSAMAQSIVNGDFEDGTTGWTLYGASHRSASWGAYVTVGPSGLGAFESDVFIVTREHIAWRSKQVGISHGDFLECGLCPHAACAELHLVDPTSASLKVDSTPLYGGCSWREHELDLSNACGRLRHVRVTGGASAEMAFDDFALQGEPCPRFVDADGDGVCSFGTDRDGDGDCTELDEAELHEVDCDDSDATFRPGADDVPGDASDQNCDGLLDCYSDEDGDGRGESPIIGWKGSCDDFGVAPRRDDVCVGSYDGDDWDEDGIPDGCDFCPNDPDPACEVEAQACSCSAPQGGWGWGAVLLLGAIHRRNRQILL